MPEESNQSGSSDKDFLATFARGLDVIKSFDAESPSMTLTDLAKKNGLSRASARRFLLTLQKLGYVSNDDKHFKLTAKILDLGYSYLSSLNFTEIITPYMEGVAHQLRESCSANVLDGQDIVYIARIPRRGLIHINLQIGARLPAYATSSGRVLLSGLPTERLETFIKDTSFEALTPSTMGPEELYIELQNVKQQGYAIVDQELELGMRAVAVPVYDRRKQVRFAMNVSTHVSSHSVEQIKDEFVPVMQEAAQKMSDVLP
ncbi:MAG: IclR family transcriptional regulator domain-containing protein [Cellvibrionaceae bacterium]|uniref:Helix-turn-helix domain-containing protein n=1 Tax=Dasania phycosphaerae TaxID=2950436 RepID=A0A9J6RPN1_9GAMM|nr:MULTISPECIES: IclR family transcriptional regulator C-terminal domain-containing protein [Dasania]MCR8923872.1 helix-turn-helix domain-containing protein [Dasania sp. GY-MA-18]MCZ0866306.1 helix-turn-helix domain-containing protein [Dasania phycosphaerae]MCZ0870030.1 helix-turn-helix domain-containing protein [Dasania phycosphaerae]